jgi:hypothetical protein
MTAADRTTMSLYSEMPLFCCICGVTYAATVNRTWHGFDQAVCGAACYYEKEWRKTLSTLGKAYYPDPRSYDAAGYPVKVTGAADDRR